MKEIESEEQHRVWFCVIQIQHILTSINVCCRSVLMKEIESEEQHRVWFYRQLESITNKLETLPLSDTVSSSLYLSPCADARFSHV